MMLRISTIFLVVIALSSPLHANLIQNGSFSTGDFTDWTVFSTANGSLGVRPLPRITSFDVSGTGPTIAAEFQVGQTAPNPTGPPAGGGIKQAVTIPDAGVYRFSADIAALSLRVNADAGNASVLVDGITEDTVNFGSILSNPPFMPLLRDTLTFTTFLIAGTHEIEILITRSLQNSMLSPDQFITNITLVDPDPVPEPATWTILVVALVALAIARSHSFQHQARRRHTTAQRSG
jgi:hypothetical protein